ncbi:sacsin N-terminal ATP-binding-like domain-containing protein [Mycolicibacterium tusciae]|uniref:Sacsin/Nov domain-containing protein n=1 Tax=Mycolicibacterium tusciae TaxID=75922 RepID=A0A1X0K1E4_9MYCO|nr:ATP-binding protein [Mycolicibacterium tusciae]ORB68790.1 hypothetical protein BST47_02570 [Mycolicibacterium tusciae]
MPSDYAAIREEHRLDYGRKVGNFGGVLVDLYSDRTHFLLELLQNAQDAHATRVRFDLHPDRLEVRHDGRHFTEADVRGICGIKESTKEDDPDQIGRFGVGFKSVYAYTSRPTVHCGDEHFQVQDYVLPHRADPVDPGAGWSTLQILPFDRSDVTPQDAVDQISRRLQRLSGRTILFLSNLTELQWFAPGGLSDHILRETRTDREARRVSLLAGADSESEEEWLVFDRQVHLADGIDPGAVEVAFALTRDDRGAELITPADDTQLVAFFPTRRETHVGFLIQGPFVPTAARDNVRDDHPLNRRLVADVAALTVEALEAIKEMGLLAVGVLETLPLETAKFSPKQLLRPLYDAVRDALTDRPLLPTADGRYLAATEVRLARGAGLRELFSPVQLGELLDADGEVAWLVAGISADRTHILHRYLVGHRPPYSWGSDPEIPALVPGMELDPGAISRRIEPSFLARQSTEWIISLYRWLAAQPALHATLRLKPVIVSSDGEYIAAFADGRPQVWLPPDGETSYPVVDRAVAADPEALAFLCSLGLTEPDAADEVMDTILPRYRGDGEMPNQDEGTSNLDRIAAALTGATGAKLDALIDELIDTPFLLASDPTDNERYWCRPTECYEPSERLKVFMEGNEDVFFLTDESLRHIALWRRLGVKSDIEIRKRDPDWHGYVTVTRQHGWHKRGRHRFDPGLEIDGLEHALEHPTLERSLLVWELISSLDAPIRGQVETCPRKDYSGSWTHTVNSPVADLLAEHHWLLDLDGNWRRPEEVTLDDLDPSYPRDEVLARVLEMRPTVSHGVADEVADLFGIDSDDLDLLRRQPELLKRAVAEARERERGARVDEGGDADGMHDENDSDNESIDVAEGIFDAFNRPGEAEVEDFDGDGAAANPERRQERSAEALARSKEAEPSRGDRFKLLSRKVWEARDPAVRAYLLHTYGGRCQICQATFPRRDGQPFFEARYIVSRVEQRWLDTPGNSLCLCPTCLAKTLHGSSKAVDILHELRELAGDAVNLPDGGTASFELCGEPVSIRFAQRHLIDLGALLAAESVEPQ